MNKFNWFRKEKNKNPEPSWPEASKSQEPATVNDADVLGMLKKMLAEEIKTGDFDPDKMRESLAVGMRQAQMLKRKGSALIPGLSQALRSRDARIRVKSCWSLQMLGEEYGLPGEALAGMAELLSDGEQSVRLQAIHSLGALSPKVNLATILPALTAALKSSDWDLRKRTIGILGKMGADNAAVLESLYPMLKDPNVDVAEAARAAILKLGGKMEASAAGSLDEIEHLASLTTSAEYSVKSKAWSDLEKAPNREKAVAPLMKAFRKPGGRILSTDLPKFLGKIGTEESRAALLEIRAAGLQSSNEWEQKYLPGSASSALLSMTGGVEALRQALPAGTLRAIISSGLMSADERGRSASAATLTAAERGEAIEDLRSFFRSSADKSDSYLPVSGALGSLGMEAIGPLLEVLRNVKPSTIQPDGSVRDGDGGQDGPPAIALARIPGGIEKIKALCTAEEYEKILVRAHAYGAMDHAALNTALGEIATPKAIGRLTQVLWQDHWEAETRRPAKEALIKAGKKAYESLLKTLEIKLPADRRFQTHLRKEALAVLAESGDETCIAGIQSVLGSDPAVAEEARAALAAIGERCGMGQPAKAAETSAAKSLTLKKIAKTGDPYVDDCFQIDFEEMYEEREWSNMPEAKIIPSTANAGQVDEALRLAEELRDRYPDFYFAYYWLGALRRKQKRPEDGRKILLEGLKFARKKQSLCSALGDLEWERKNLPEAVKWWVKSVAVQVGSEYVSDYPSFLYLSYVAEGLGNQPACTELRNWVDRMRPGQIRLNGDAANEFYQTTHYQATPGMRLAIKTLEKEYLAKKE